MNKLLLLTLISLGITACGQKGPLIVDQAPINQEGQTADEEAGEASISDTEIRVGRQVDGEPSTIYR